MTYTIEQMKNYAQTKVEKATGFAVSLLGACNFGLDTCNVLWQNSSYDKGSLVSALAAVGGAFVFMKARGSRMPISEERAIDQAIDASEDYPTVHTFLPVSGPEEPLRLVNPLGLENHTRTVHEAHQD